MATVTFDKATRIYPGSEKPAVDQLEIEIADGEFLVLVGPSGCCLLYTSPSPRDI